MVIVLAPGVLGTLYTAPPAPPAAVSSRKGGCAISHVDIHPFAKQFVCHAARAIDARRPDPLHLRNVGALVVEEEHLAQRHARLARNVLEVSHLNRVQQQLHSDGHVVQRPRTTHGL